MCGRSECVGIIPARWGSSRFPGKPLADIGGQPMIERVWRRAAQVLPRVVIATDDERIIREADRMGAESVMTSADCINGTQRVAEAYSLIGRGEGIVVDIQGDEPMIDPEVIAATARRLIDSHECDIATAAHILASDTPFDRLNDPNRVKMTVSLTGEALCFSRSVIPYLRGIPCEEWPSRHPYLIHTGLYAFRASALGSLAASAPTPLEQCEGLEQLRWLQQGHRISTFIYSGQPAHPIDTPADLTALLACFKDFQ